MGTIVAIGVDSSIAPELVGVSGQRVQTQFASTSGAGTVTEVTGTAPIVITSNAELTPNVTIVPATDSVPGSMSSADKTKLDGITAGAAVASVGVTGPIENTGSAHEPVIAISLATDGAAGSMSAADKTKLDGLSATPVDSVTVVSPLENVNSAQNPELAIIPGTVEGQTLVWNGTTWAAAVPASAVAVNTSNQGLTNVPAVVAGAQVTVTPRVSGKFYVSVTGSVTNSDSTGVGHAAVIGFSHGGTTSLDFATSVVPPTKPSSGAAALAGFALSVNADQLPTPVGPFALGTPVIFDVVAVCGDASGELTLENESVVITVQERFG